MSYSIAPVNETKEMPAYVPDDADFYFYRVKQGEDLEDIAAKFSVPAQAVALGDPAAELIPGQVVEINLKSFKNSFC